jgi:hypothetical protein
MRVERMCEADDNVQAKVGGRIEIEEITRDLQTNLGLARIRA